MSSQLLKKISRNKQTAVNTNLLKTWHSNMDMQHVLDPYACETIILSYISQTELGTLGTNF